jgi:hypothetical protein
LVDAGDDFQRELIRSAFSDRPRDGAVEDMLVGLGVGVTALSSAVASTAPSAAAGSKLGGAALLKWLVTGAALGVASAGGMHLTVRALEARHVPALKSSEQRASRAAYRR